MPASIREVFDGRRRDEADLVTAEYVKPEGLELHRVKIGPDDAVRIVGSLVGAMTYASGSNVVVATFSGDRQVSIIGIAPPGQQGASELPTQTSEDALRAPSLLAAIPSAIISGEVDQVVYLIGLGLSESPLDSFDAVKGFPGSYSGDPFVVLHDPEWVADPSAVGLELGQGMQAVKVLADSTVAAPDGYSIDVRVD